MKFRLQPLLKETLAVNKRFYFRVLKKIPTFVWGAFAVFGVLCLGVILGIAIYSIETEMTEIDYLRQENAALKELVTGYEQMTRLYQDDRTNTGKIMDIETMLSDRELAEDTFTQADLYTNLIMMQYGRLMELRKNAGLPDIPEDYEETQSNTSFL